MNSDPLNSDDLLDVDNAKETEDAIIYNQHNLDDEDEHQLQNTTHPESEEEDEIIISTSLKNIQLHLQSLMMPTA